MSIKTWNAETQTAEPLVPGTVEVEHYSTEEVKTNKTWIDGKPIYRKVFASLNTSVTKNDNWQDTGIIIPNIEQLISFEPRRGTNGSALFSVGEVGIGSGKQIKIASASIASTMTMAIVEYTKTTD